MGVDVTHTHTRVRCRMSGGKKRSGFQITSVTSDVGGSPASKIPGTQDVLPRSLWAGPRRHSAHSKEEATPPSALLNGPGCVHTLSHALLTQQSSSQPATPVTVRKQRSLDQAALGGGASRFRVVRLGQGLGEPYRRGRWTCVDVLEREAELQGVRRVMDSMRHAHSLESLETVGLGRPEGEGGVTLKSLKELRAGHMVHSQGSAHLVAHDGPPSPTHTEQETHPPNTPRSRKIPPPLHLLMGGANTLRATRSQPTSPGPPVRDDGSFLRVLTPIHTPAALALAQSMFGVGGAFGLVSDESGSSNSMIAIDNKIEQAMDLVKAHLMLAVREEVEVLREQIKELVERNAQLERENYILRALHQNH